MKGLISRKMRKKAEKSMRKQLNLMITRIVVYFDGESHVIDYSASSNNIHIKDSYKYHKRKQIDTILDAIFRIEDDSPVFANRERWSLASEWRVHTRLYKLGLWKSRTKDVDLNWPIKWYMVVLYNIFGL